MLQLVIVRVNIVRVNIDRFYCKITNQTNGSQILISIAFIQEAFVETSVQICGNKSHHDCHYEKT